MLLLEHIYNFGRCCSVTVYYACFLVMFKVKTMYCIINACQLVYIALDADTKNAIRWLLLNILCVAL